MDARQFYKLIKKHPGDTFELDFHHAKDETGIKKRIGSLLEDFQNDTCTLDRMLIQTKFGNLEYQDPVKWENDGQRKLSKCMFEVPGAHFVGWRMRTKIDGRFLWYCTDHMYHN